MFHVIFLKLLLQLVYWMMHGLIKFKIYVWIKEIYFTNIIDIILIIISESFKILIKIHIESSINYLNK